MTTSPPRSSDAASISHDRLQSSSTPTDNTHDGNAAFLKQSQPAPAAPDSTTPSQPSLEASARGHDKFPQLAKGAASGCDPDRYCDASGFGSSEGRSESSRAGIQGHCRLPCKASACACDPDRAYHSFTGLLKQTDITSQLQLQQTLGAEAQRQLDMDCVNQDSFLHSISATAGMGLHLLSGIVCLMFLICRTLGLIEHCNVRNNLCKEHLTYAGKSLKSL